MIKYDEKYFDNMLHMYVGTSAHIPAIRWAFVGEVGVEIILDYGSGCGFFSLHQPDGVTVDTYDIGTYNGGKYPQTGLRHKRYDLITFWDVLEHIDWNSDPDMDILAAIRKTDHVALTIPIRPVNACEKDWRHYKPGEHLTYFTKDSLLAFFDRLGFELVVCGDVECPPRQDVWSFLFRRKA